MTYRNIIFAVFLLVLLINVSDANAYAWLIPRDFDTIQDAVDSTLVENGDQLIIQRGRHAGAVVTKSLIITGRKGAIIDSGPVFIAEYPCVGDMEAGFLLQVDAPDGSSGAVIQNLVFDNLEFPIYGRNVDHIGVFANIMTNPIQGITTRGGQNWYIAGNWIRNMRTANGGGIAIYITDSDARPEGIFHHFVSGNTISGTLSVSSCDVGGYSGGGIILNADFRSGAGGAEAIYENYISWNRIRMVSDTPSVVDMAGIVLEDSRGDESVSAVIFDNAIFFNDLHTLGTPTIFSPETLMNENMMYWNWI